MSETSVVVVASVDTCLGPCSKCVGFYIDSPTKKYRVDCFCKCHQESNDKTKKQVVEDGQPPQQQPVIPCSSDIGTTPRFSARSRSQP
jgi:hypothetical protein